MSDIGANERRSLLEKYARLMSELRRAGIIQTGNPSLGEYAEARAEVAFGGKRQSFAQRRSRPSRRWNLGALR